MYKYIHTESVIIEVRKRPVLWDPTHALNKDRDARTLSWIEVYEALYPDYDDMEDAKRKEIGKLIQQRWKTARDAYIRSKKFQKQGINKKHYGFSEELRFLDKVDQSNQTEADSSNGTVTPNFVECVYEDSSQSTPDTAIVEVKVEPQEPESTKPIQDSFGQKKVQDPFGSQPDVQEPFGLQPLVQEPFGLQPLIQESFQLESPIEGPMKKTCNPSKKPRIMRKRKLSSSTSDFQKEMMGMLKENSKLLRNDDLAFFMSLLPITKDFTVQQKLSFRIEVLKVALKISKNQHEVKSDSENSCIE